MRRFLVLALTAAAFAALAPASGAGVVTLRPGDAHFWDGPHIDQADEKTFVYQIRVTDRAERLRIGIDHPEVDDEFSVSIRHEDGGAWSGTAGGGVYSGETLIDHPKEGLYRIAVTADAPSDTAFRVRAKLEKELPSLGVKDGPVLPNLQVLPPHEASFLFPVTNGATSSTEHIGLDTGGAESCHPEEHVEDLAVRCLRFAYGVRNTGRGPLSMFYEGNMALPEQPLYQRVFRANGTWFDREAGTERFHRTHGHVHHDAAIGLQLWKVLDEKKGELEPAGAPRTKGFAHREELLREWDRFYPTWQPFGFGLRPGWADIYEWDRPGNYISFGLNGDGLYVVRMQADPVEGILESNERDNFGYTYLRVTGDEVELLEAGRGMDPWDRCKIVVGFGGHPDPKQPPRPKDCPKDTV